jgi:hypothetical protein
MVGKNTRKAILRKGSSAVGPVPIEVGGLELDARRSQRTQTVGRLKAGRIPLNVIEVAANAAALAEAAIREAMEMYPPPALACKEGCDWCCHLTVGTSVPEVARIADYLRRTFSPEELRATLERIVKLDEQKRDAKANNRAEEPLPCALLVDHHCSVYPVRPLTCRGCNSTDPDPCERFLRSRRVVIPLYAPQHRLTAFVLDGMRAGLSESGLKGDRLELTAALRIALEMPDAVERWLAGEPVFAPARLP